eukprot:m.13620 g.13620  ORF g.13620 m.13620 type:complete len:299 (-) comp10190_c0_seq1:153-1049(-)
MCARLHHTLAAVVFVMLGSVVVPYRTGSYNSQAPSGGHRLWSTRNPKFYVCLTAKVACSEWLRYIHGEMVPEGLWSPTGPELYLPHQYPEYGLHRFDKTSRQSLARVRAIARDPSVYKFAVVRHPWDRLNSGFRSKYEGCCNFNNDCFIKKFVPTMPKKEGVYTFHDFVKALSEIPPSKLNEHFRPQTLTCDLTTFPYDGFVELKNSTQMDLAGKTSGFKTAFSNVSQEYGPVALASNRRTFKCHACTWETVRIAETIYQEDARTLGYSFEDAYRSCKDHGVSVWKPDMNVSDYCSKF